MNSQDAAIEMVDIDGERDDKTVPDIPWTEEHENILVDWADKPMCYRWMHTKANNIYSSKNAWYTIPVIIMSTLTGTANFAQDRIPEDYRFYAPMMIGAVNIFAGILTTIQQFLKITELNEAHRVASISWDKFYRNIKVELAKHPRERTAVAQMLKLSKEEFDRLMETSPVIGEDIINEFQKTFNKLEPGSEKATAFDELKKPEICDSLESTRYSVYKAKDEPSKGPSSTMLELIKRKRDETRKAEIVETFIKNFRKEYSREPTAEEVYENLKEEVAKDIVTKVFAANKPRSSVDTARVGSMFRNAVGALSAQRALGDTIERPPENIWNMLDL